MSKVWLLFALCSALITSAAAATSTHHEAAPFISQIEAVQSAASDEFDQLTLPALMQQLHVPGLSIAVVKDFKIHWAKAYGVADAATGRLVATNTRFQAASISKPVTAMAAGYDQILKVSALPPVLQFDQSTPEQILDLIQQQGIKVQQLYLETQDFQP